MTKPTLLYDETCGFCTSMVQWVQRQKRGGEITVLSCQFALLTKKFPVTDRDCATSIHLFKPVGERTTKARAVADVLDIVWDSRWPTRIATLPVVSKVLDLGYTFIAVNRHRLPGIKQWCAAGESSRCGIDQGK